MTKQQRRSVAVVGVVLVERDRVLIVRRPPGDTGAGFWEFPGGKIEVGESPEQALHREIDEELNIRVHLDADLGRHVHAYDTADVDLRLYAAHWVSGELALSEHDAKEWIRPAELDPARLLAADRPFLPAILAFVEKAARGG